MGSAQSQLEPGRGFGDPACTVTSACEGITRSARDTFDSAQDDPELACDLEASPFEFPVWVFRSGREPSAKPETQRPEGQLASPRLCSWAPPAWSAQPSQLPQRLYARRVFCDCSPERCVRHTYGSHSTAARRHTLLRPCRESGTRSGQMSK